MAETATLTTDSIETARDRRLRVTASNTVHLLAAAEHAGAGNPQTRALPAERCQEHGEEFAAVLRLIVERWAHCKGPVPQLLSLAVMEGKRALNEAGARE